MSYDTFERSLQSGAPIDLYDFTIGLEHFRYTSAGKVVVFAGQTFAPEQIDRSEIEEAEELSRANVTVTVPRDFHIAEEFRISPPSYVILLSIYTMHDGDSERKLRWSGRVLNAAWEGISAALHCESILTSLQRPGLRRLYQRGCPHVLYGTKCGLLDSAYKVPTAVATVTGISVAVTVGDIAPDGDGFYAGGFVEVEVVPGKFARRAIRDQVGDILTLTHPIVDLAPGMAIDVYPGCDHTLATCNTKFANALNFGGTPFITVKNPFGSSGL